MGSEYTLSHAAALASMLPRTARIRTADNPDLEWSDDTYLLARIAYMVEVLVWQGTEDGKKGRRKPKPPMTPGQYKAMKSKVENTDVDYISRRLNINDS